MPKPVDTPPPPPTSRQGRSLASETARQLGRLPLGAALSASLEWHLLDFKGQWSALDGAVMVRGWAGQGLVWHGSCHMTHVAWQCFAGVFCVWGEVGRWGGGAGRGSHQSWWGAQAQAQAL